ncbi:MAG: dynamin family protein [Fusobacteriaceae bacterium]|jgi:GTP-binding protein EngB required for normal cell division|nr:dynamin family protein [Fusobacteriaceae bacterium]
MSNEENEIKLKLMSAAINAEPINNIYIKEFENLIEKDFKEFCNNELVVNSANAIDNLRHILHNMQNIASFPELHSKTLGAIGGGYSSGKSSFINSFITDSRIKLAEGVLPVTAIPSYVVAGNSPKVNGINDKGGIFDIDFKLYKSINHEFLKEFAFDLKKIIRYITVLCPMKEDLFDNICLIDTPGYNSPSSVSKKHDFEIAKEYIKDTQFFIWIIDIERGTIPKDDLKFLNECGFGENKDSVQNRNRKLYVVINKADLKPQGYIEDIIDEITEVLDDNDIIYEGICTYSSRMKKIYNFCKIDIIDFLLDQNVSNVIYGTLADILDDVFCEYYLKINHNIKENEKKRKEVKAIELGMIESGIDLDSEAYAMIEKGLNKLTDHFEPEESTENRIERLNQIYEQFLNCLNDFCDEMGIDRPITRKLRKTFEEILVEKEFKEEFKKVYEVWEEIFIMLEEFKNLFR